MSKSKCYVADYLCFNEITPRGVTKTGRKIEITPSSTPILTGCQITVNSATDLTTLIQQPFMKKTVYQIQIALKGFKPKIWRRVLIPPDMLLPEFHYLIQRMMGWENCHLHQFIQNGIFYSEPREEEWDDMDTEDYTGLRVSDLLAREKDSLIYEYDFGAAGNT
jgi:hypothetical protein